MRLGSYETVAEIGRGGMGVVYRARSADPGAPLVAIKVLTSAAPDALERFEREQRLLTTLTRGEGFVPLLEAGIALGRPFLVMPFVSGGTLEARLERGPLPIAEATRLVQTVARAVRSAHERGIVHRDLKPANILFDENGRPLVADLGLAKHFRRDVAGASQSRALSEQGAFAGTLGYMAPEQLGDATSVAPQADVFALGVLLFRCIAGTLPFATDGVFRYAKAIEGPPPSLRALRPGTPRWLDAVVARAIARDPAGRFADAGALALALDAPPRRGGRALLGAGALALLTVAVAVGVTLGLPAPPPPPRLETPHPRAKTPAVKPESGAEKAAGLVQAGKRRIETHDLAGAIEDLTRAIELDPANVEALIDRGDALDLAGDSRAAIPDLDRAIRLAPRNPEAWNQRALVRANLRDPSGALADIARAIELDPTNAKYWCARGITYDQLGDREKALPAYSRAIELDPKRVDALTNRSTIRGLEGDRRGEAEDLDRAVESDPGDPSCRLNRAIMHRKRGETAAAVADYARWLELVPDDPDAPAVRAWVDANRR